jgi:feruloyl-CoA synthase
VLNIQAMGDTFAWDRQVLDWMPWSHIGGSCLLTNVSYLGGTLHIDDGRPSPGRFVETLQNLREIPLRCYSNVPSGYAMLIEALEVDAELRAMFFGDLRAMLFGGAGLPQALHDRFQRLSIATTGSRFAFVSGYGSTETASAISVTYWPATKTGIGLPAPGVTLKLVPVDDAYEVRVKAPSLTPGYLNDPQRTAEAFDEEGFLRMGDLARFHDPDHLEEGLLFAGRMSEQFKLSNATFVAAGKVREQFLAVAPGLFQDVVICGDGRDALTALAWPNPERRGDAPEVFRAQVQATMARHNTRLPGQSTRLQRLLLLSEPPSVEAHEISDKGSINRSNVLRRRLSEVERLYANPPDADVISVA